MPARRLSEIMRGTHRAETEWPRLGEEAGPTSGGGEERGDWPDDSCCLHCPFAWCRRFSVRLAKKLARDVRCGSRSAWADFPCRRSRIKSRGDPAASYLQETARRAPQVPA